MLMLQLWYLCIEYQINDEKYDQLVAFVKERVPIKIASAFDWEGARPNTISSHSNYDMKSFLDSAGIQWK